LKLRLVVISLAISLLLTIPAFADIVLFDDGATNGQFNALFIDGPNGQVWNQYISDGFTATGGGVATSLDFGMWVPTGTLPVSVSWWLGTSAFAGDIGSGSVAQVNYTYFGSSAYGYDVYNIHIDGLSGNITQGQTYWLSLGNATDNFGTGYDGWDANYGPATCNFNQGGVNYGDCGLGSGNAFTLYGTPEPGTMVLLGGGILAAAGALRRKIGF
jgi:hypothetical protein